MLAVRIFADPRSRMRTLAIANVDDERELESEQKKKTWKQIVVVRKMHECIKYIYTMCTATESMRGFKTFDDEQWRTMFLHTN